jgi:D-xylose transport system ATP-binding protein
LAELEKHPGITLKVNAMEDYILQMEGISKVFPGVLALDNVTFKVKRGEIHGLVGENGAGKSTLMKILSGVYTEESYSGKMIVNGTEQRYTCIHDSEKAGVAIVYQELGLVRTMTVCENIFLGNEIKRRRIIDWDAQYKQCRELLKIVNLNVNPTVEVGSLGTGMQQLIEIAKAVNKKVQLLILDEPTSSLTESETKNLLGLLKDIKKRGVTCIFISHKLNEVMEISDTITILRDGKTIVTKTTNEFNESSIISYMVGREITDRFPRSPHVPGNVVLEVKDWTVINPENPNKYLLDHINIKVRQGEILGIAGLVGAGRTELAMSLFGASATPIAGNLSINGKSVGYLENPKQAIKSGLAYLPEDRKRYGLVLSNDIRTNMTLASLEKIAKFSVIDQSTEIKLITEMIEQLKVKTPSVFQKTMNLSGGNQQKVVIAKWLLTLPQVLFLDEPTRGIDVGSKHEIYQLMNKMVDNGICIVMISSELPEILGQSDRIYVMHEGKIQAELDNKVNKVTQEEILYYAAGGE